MKSTFLTPSVCVLILVCHNLVFAQTFTANDNSKQVNAPYNQGTINVNQYLVKSDDYKALVKQSEDLENDIKIKAADCEEDKKDNKMERYERDYNSLVLLNRKRDSINNIITQFKEDVLRLAETLTKISTNSERLRNAKALFEQGKFREANYVLNEKEMRTEGEALLLRESKVKREQQEIDSLKRIKSDEYLVKAQAKSVDYADPLWMDSTLLCFEISLKYYENVDNLLELANFLYHQNETLKTITYYERALSISKTDDLIGSICMNLGVAYYSLSNMLEAEKYYLKSFDIYRQLTKTNPQLFEPDLARTAMNLGIYYQTVNNMPEAEKYYLESFDIYGQLTKTNPQQFEPDLARATNKLVEYYRVNNNMSEVILYYRQSLVFKVRFSKTNPRQFEPNLARMAINSDINYQTVNEMLEVEKLYLSYLDVSERLAKTNPQRFEPDLARAARNLGKYYSDLSKMPEAEKYYLKSLDIYERLAKTNPQQFEPDLGLTMYNLGLLYEDQKAYSKAEKYLLGSLSIYEKWEKASPSVFGKNRKKMWGVVIAFYETWQAATSSQQEKAVIAQKLISLLERE